MSASRSVVRAVQSCSRASSRSASSTTPSTSSLPPLKASLILSRQPLLTRTLHPLEDAYYAHNRNVRHALSNPLPEHFYFREKSVPHRRYQHSEWQYLKETYGEIIAGPEPEVGDIPPERAVEMFSRDHWEKEDAQRGEKSLERKPEEEVFCLVQSKESGAWGLPEVVLGEQETLHGAIEQRITGQEGWFGGKTMDTWLVTKKPVGCVQRGEQWTFFMRSHILGGEPILAKDSPWKAHAWLNRSEVEARLTDQSPQQWRDVRGIFGSHPEHEAESGEAAQEQ